MSFRRALVVLVLLAAPAHAEHFDLEFIGEITYVDDLTYYAGAPLHLLPDVAGPVRIVLRFDTDLGYPSESRGAVGLGTVDGAFDFGGPDVPIFPYSFDPAQFLGVTVAPGLTETTHVAVEPSLLPFDFIEFIRIDMSDRVGTFEVDGVHPSLVLQYPRFRFGGTLRVVPEPGSFVLFLVAAVLVLVVLRLMRWNLSLPRR